MWPGDERQKLSPLQIHDSPPKAFAGCVPGGDAFPRWRAKPICSAARQGLPAAPAAVSAARPQAVASPLLIKVWETRSRWRKTSGYLKMNFPNLIIFLLLQHMLRQR